MNKKLCKLVLDIFEFTQFIFYIPRFLQQKFYYKTIINYKEEI